LILIDSGIRRYSIKLLADQLRPHITSNDASLAARELAIDLAEACEVVELEDELATLALDRSAQLRSRINAAYAISHRD
jgi:hypothetical protein